jgi:hypothetical protein
MPVEFTCHSLQQKKMRKQVNPCLCHWGRRGAVHTASASGAEDPGSNPASFKGKHSNDTLCT